jgi:hypothetical protein
MNEEMKYQIDMWKQAKNRHQDWKPKITKPSDIQNDFKKKNNAV